MSDNAQAGRAACSKVKRSCRKGRAFFALVFGLTAGFVVGNTVPVSLRDLASRLTQRPAPAVATPAAKNTSDPKELVRRLERTEADLRTKLDLVRQQVGISRRELKISKDRGDDVTAKEGEIADLQKKGEAINARLEEVTAARRKLNDALKSEDEALKVDDKAIDEILIRAEINSPK
jgi:hypothetical protein